MLEKLQLIKIANRSYWLNDYFTKLKSISTGNDDIINILDAYIIDAGMTNLVFCFSIFRKSVS